MTNSDLLIDTILGFEDQSQLRGRTSLPGLLARLSHGEPTELVGLQAHQQHPWHAFTVQLAAIALHRAGITTIAHDETTWRRILIAAATHDGGGSDSYSLVVGDLTKPAFLQPPVPEGVLTPLKTEHEFPSEELDVLITAKNHDVKLDPLLSPSAEHWVFALVALQTTQGFLGAGNYGVARMNGGFASRPGIAFASEQTAAARFARDLQALLAARPGLLSRGYTSKGDLGLVWCAPWDGTKSLPFSQLDPFFIEVCRRIRLTARDGVLIAHRGSSKCARIDTGESTGNTGDPWTPVARKDAKALTMAETGFHFDRVQDLLFGEWNHGAAGEPDAGGADRYWVGQVLVRGQGKTGGYHERWVPIPKKTRGLLSRRDARADLGKRSRDWVELAATVRLKVLKPAVLAFLQGGPDKLKFDDDRAEPFLQRFNHQLDGAFFPLLFEHAEADGESAQRAYERTLYELARAEFERALQGVPVVSARRWRAIAFAERAFEGSARTNLKLHFSPRLGADPKEENPT